MWEPFASSADSESLYNEQSKDIHPRQDYSIFCTLLHTAPGLHTQVIVWDAAMHLYDNGS